MLHFPVHLNYFPFPLLIRVCLKTFPLVQICTCVCILSALSNCTKQLILSNFKFSIWKRFWIWQFSPSLTWASYWTVDTLAHQVYNPPPPSQDIPQFPSHFSAFIFPISPGLFSRRFSDYSNYITGYIIQPVIYCFLELCPCFPN